MSDFLWMLVGKAKDHMVRWNICCKAEIPKFESQRMKSVLNLKKNQNYELMYIR